MASTFRNHSWRIKKAYYIVLEKGIKTIEVRVGYPQVLKVKVGDTITFDDYSNQPFKVLGITRYSNFRELLDAVDSQKIIPNASKEQVLSVLHLIYPAEKEALGVLAFKLCKTDEVKVLSAQACIKNHKAFGELVAKAYSITDYICEDYPDHFEWYWGKTVPAVLKGTREILVCTVNNKIAGVAFLKNEDGEKKICTFLVKEEYRGNRLATRLLERSFKFLGTTKPLITIADYKLKMFEPIIKQYGWVQTEILEEGYYNETSREYVFNGNLS